MFLYNSTGAYGAVENDINNQVGSMYNFCLLECSIAHAQAHINVVQGRVVKTHPSYVTGTEKTNINVDLCYTYCNFNDTFP